MWKNPRSAFFLLFHIGYMGLPWWLSGKESACIVGATGDLGSIPGSGRSPGRGHGNPLWYSCLENPMDRGAWWAIVHSVTNSWTQLKQLSAYTGCMEKFPYLCSYIGLAKKFIQVFLYRLTKTQMTFLANLAYN